MYYGAPRPASSAISTMAPKLRSRSSAVASCAVAADDVVRDGADRQRAAAETGGQGVERAGLHLHGEHAVLDHPGGQLRAGRVERVAAEDQPYVGTAVPFRRGGRVAQQLEVGNRREVEPLEGDPVHRGVGAGARGDHEIAERQPIGQRPAGPDPDDGLYVVLTEQLVDVDRRRRLAHPRALHRDRAPMPGAGVSVHPSDLGVAARVLEEGLRDPGRATGVAGHQDDRGDVAGSGADVGAHSGQPRES